MLKDEAAAEDVFQEVFVRVMRHWSWKSEKEIPLSWLYRTAERCCFDRIRKYKREPIYNPEHPIESLVVLNGEDQSESTLMLTRFFSKLKPKLKQLSKRAKHLSERKIK
ncbi:MAG: hypothetical protein GY847_14665 [Proteobacteria bacterium]|nr:hypothetical protein [Pseudomonadota bacterium]